MFFLGGLKNMRIFGWCYGSPKGFRSIGLRLCSDVLSPTGLRTSTALQKTKPFAKPKPVACHFNRNNNI